MSKSVRKIVVKILLMTMVVIIFANVSFLEVRAADVLITYPDPIGLPLNTDWTVKARTPGSTWTELYEYVTYHTYWGDNDDTPSEPDAMVMFDMDGSVEVEAVYNRGSVSSAEIYPKSLNSTYTPQLIITYQ